jgi:hypothetical protein
MTTDPKLKQHQEMLFRSVSLLAQSESEYPCSLTPSPPRYYNPYPTVPYKYLSMCSVSSQCTSLSSTMNWLRVLTVKQMSSRVLTRYIYKPIRCQYYLRSANSESEESIFLRLVTIGVAIVLLSSILNLFKISRVLPLYEEDLSWSLPNLKSQKVMHWPDILHLKFRR